MSALVDAVSSGLIVLRGRIAALQAEHAGDLISALLAEANDPQLLIDELGVLLRQNVVRVSDLSHWVSQFDRLSFAESARRGSRQNRFDAS